MEEKFFPSFSLLYTGIYKLEALHLCHLNLAAMRNLNFAALTCRL